MAYEKNYWWSLGLLFLFLFNLFVVNHIQVVLNVEMAARLFVFDKKMDEDEKFRENVLKLLESL